MFILSPGEYYDFESEYQLQIREFKFLKYFPKDFTSQKTSKSIYKNLIDYLYSLELINSHYDETDYENADPNSYEQMAYFINNIILLPKHENLFEIKKCFQFTPNFIKNKADAESMKLMFNKKLNPFFSETKYKINVQYYIIDSSYYFSVIIFTSEEETFDVDFYHKSIIKHWYENYVKWVMFLEDEH